MGLVYSFKISIHANDYDYLDGWTRQSIVSIV